MKSIISLLFLNLSIFSQVSSDTFLTVKGVPVNFNIEANGMVLTHITKHRDPYYHASAFISSVITTNIGKRVRIPVRLISEVQNFSASYSDRQNAVFRVKPTIQARLDKIIGVDSVVINVGDLWRQKHGQGLMLDQFEAQGGEVTFYRNKIFINVRDLGYGYTGYDDIFSVSAGYDSVIALRYFINIINNRDNDFGRSSGYYDYYRDIKIVSVDSYTRLNRNISIYNEAAINLKTYSKGALIGCNFNYGFKRSFIDAKIEFRYYDKNFFFEDGTPSLPFFESLTALDKSVNIYYLYLNRTDIKNYTFGGRIKGRLYIYEDFFADADIEPVTGSMNLFAYEASVGIEPELNVFLKAGIMNKFLNIDNYNFINIPEDKDMFYLDNRPFLFAKAVFSF